jgi:hypothetical protein
VLHQWVITVLSPHPTLAITLTLRKSSDGKITRCSFTSTLPGRAFSESLRVKLQCFIFRCLFCGCQSADSLSQKKTYSASSHHTLFCRCQRVLPLSLSQWIIPCLHLYSAYAQNKTYDATTIQYSFFVCQIADTVTLSRAHINTLFLL